MSNGDIWSGTQTSTEGRMIRPGTKGCYSGTIESYPFIPSLWPIIDLLVNTVVRIEKE